MQNGRIDIEVTGEVYLFIVHNRLKKHVPYSTLMSTTIRFEIILCMLLSLNKIVSVANEINSKIIKE